MSGIHSERNIRAKIQDFERQLNTDEISIPTPRPRNAARPVVAPKPSMAPQRASFSSTTEEDINTNMQDFTDNTYERFISTNNPPVPPSPAQKPQMPRKPSLNSIDQFKPLIKPPPQLPSRPSLRRTRPLNSQDEDAAFNTPNFNTPAFNTSAFNASAFNTAAFNASTFNTAAHNASAFTSSALNTTPRPRPSYNNQQNSSNHSGSRENEYVDAPVSHALANLSRGASIANAVSRKPTIIRVPSKQEQEVSDSFPPALPVQRGIGGPPTSSRYQQDSFSSVCDPALPPRPGGGKMPPHRPPLAKPAPGRPPPPRRDSIQRNSTLQPQNSTKLRRNMSKKAPVLPPRPNPRHRLYNKYTLEIPHGIAEYDYNGMNTGELSFQKNEVLVLLNQTDNQTFECQVGDARGTVQTSHMKIITPLTSYSYHEANPEPQENTSRQPFSNTAQNGTLQVQALYDFAPESPGELGLRTGDIINNVEQIDGEWYLGTSKGITGFFPINYVKVLSRQPAAAPAPTPAPPPQKVSGPRCIARFDFEGEQSDELSFTEGQVIGLLEYMGEDWAQGKIGSQVGIFPLNFVEVVEDLPPSPAKNQTKVPLPGMATSNHMQPAASIHNQTRGVEQVKALYDFTAETYGDLSFLRGDVIEVIEHIDEEWSHGRLNGKEGLFPISFTQTHTGGFSQR